MEPFMKGVVNKGIQEYAIARFGVDAWERIRECSGCEEFVFAPSQDYPDELAAGLMQAISRVMGLPLDTVQVEYGRFMVPNTLRQTYLPYFHLAGSSPKGFLLNMNEIHHHVTRSLVNARPPVLQCVELSDWQLLMHYSSVRQLCCVLRGLIEGVGLHFGQDLRVRETACMHKGDSRCTMEITFP